MATEGARLTKEVLGNNVTVRLAPDLFEPSDLVFYDYANWGFRLHNYYVPSSLVVTVNHAVTHLGVVDLKLLVGGKDWKLQGNTCWMLVPYDESKEYVVSYRFDEWEHYIRSKLGVC